MPLLFPFRKISQSARTSFGSLHLPGCCLLGEDSHSIGAPILRNTEQNLLATILIPLAVILPLSSLIFAFCALTVGNLPAFAALRLPANPLAFSALAMTGLRENQILAGEFMTADAMGFGRLSSTADVFQLRNRLQVLRPNTAGNSTKMIENRSLRHGAVQQFPRKDMRQSVFTFEAEGAITVLVGLPDPEPACSSFQNEARKSLIESAASRQRWSDNWARFAGGKREVSPSHVLPTRAWLQMLRVDAMWHTAVVIKRHAEWNQALDQFIGKRMSAMVRVAITERPVAGFINAADPKPAGSGFQNPLVESLIQRKRAGHSLNQYAANLALWQWPGSGSSTKEYAYA